MRTFIVTVDDVNTSEDEIRDGIANRLFIMDDLITVKEV